MRKRILAPALALLLMTAAGCQPAPEASVVTSKNDGAFEAALESTEETTVDDEENDGDASFVYQTSFTNTAGDITYTADVVIPAVSTAAPVIQVRPEEISAEQAQEIAAVLFDGAALYEYTGELSKSELEDAILSIREKLSDYDRLLEYYGDEDTATYVQSMYKTQLTAYESAYLTAEDTVEPQLCQWTFYPETHYYSIGDSATMYIMATVQAEDSWPMVYYVCNRNESDYCIHDIFACIGGTITTNEVYSAALERPSEEELESLRAKARTMLDEMGFSDWVIDSCEVVVRGLSTGQSSYPVKITASPTYEGIPVVKQEQIMNLKSDDVYASNYYYEEIIIEFCAGKLSYFEYQAPLEVVEIVNSNVAVLTPEEIAAQLETQMLVTDIPSYQTAEDTGFNTTVTGVSMTISEVEFGLTRIRIQNNATDFYLVPAYTFRGSCKLTYSDGMTDRLSGVTLLTVNAVDGTIINTSLGY